MLASTPASRTALAGEIAMANSGLPRGERRQPLERCGRQVGVAQDRVGAGDLVARLASGGAAWRTRSRRAPCRRGRRSPRRRGRSAPCSSASRGRGRQRRGRGSLPARWRGRRSRRPHRRRAPTSATPSMPRCTALRSALKTPPPTSSRIVPGLEAPGTNESGHLAAPVDMGAADGKQFWALHAGVILRQRDHRRDDRRASAQPATRPANSAGARAESAACAAAASNVRHASGSRSPKQKKNKFRIFIAKQ